MGRAVSGQDEMRKGESTGEALAKFLKFSPLSQYPCWGDSRHNKDVTAVLSPILSLELVDGKYGVKMTGAAWGRCHTEMLPSFLTH